jgi:hypothetical protein
VPPPAGQARADGREPAGEASPGARPVPCSSAARGRPTRPRRPSAALACCSFPLLVPLLPITYPAGVQEQADVVGRRWCCRCRRAPRVARPTCFAFACEERGSVYLHLLSPEKELCIPFCISCWRRKPEGTVASGRQKCFCLPLLDSV